MYMSTVFDVLSRFGFPVVAKRTAKDAIGNTVGEEWRSRDDIYPLYSVSRFIARVHTTCKSLSVII